MSRRIFGVMIIAVCAALVSCATPQFFTVTIYDSPSQNVRLQTMSVLEEGRSIHILSLFLKSK